MLPSFQGSPEPSVGVELELQILDPATGDLAPGGLRILSACEAEGIEGVAGEFLLSTIEVRSDVCRDVSQLRENLLPRLRQVSNIAKSLGYDLALGGTHPFAKPTMASFSPGERYQKLLKREGSMAYQETVFGQHVHVGVPDADAAIGIVNRTVEFLPHLLALSANSPYWQGTDTEYVSARSRLFRPTASTGIPMHFENWEAFDEYCQAMQDAELIETTKDIYWDIRPQAKFGTVEYRIFDMPSTLAAVFGSAALTRCLVVDNLRYLQENPDAVKGEPQAFWLARENRWLASRYGLDTLVARRPDAKRQNIADEVKQLIASLTPVADELGETEFLNSVHPERGLEIGADRQRTLFRQSGDWHAVVDDMRSRWLKEIDDAAEHKTGIASNGHAAADKQLSS